MPKCKDCNGNPLCEKCHGSGKVSRIGFRRTINDNEVLKLLCKYSIYEDLHKYTIAETLKTILECRDSVSTLHYVEELKRKLLDQLRSDNYVFSSREGWSYRD